MTRLLLLLSFFFISCSKKHKLQETIQLPHYPSSSGISYFKKQIYITGDDAKHLLILDSNYLIKDSVTLYSHTEYKIPKATKPDLECVTITATNKLLILGSGSSIPYRNTGWLIDPVTKQKDSLRLDTFYRRLKNNGLEEINIEGVCAIPGNIILSNRGNKTNRKNFLVLTRKDFWINQTDAPVTLIRVGANTDSTVFNGVSGLDYSNKSDRLLLTVSTEDTRNSIDDGTIGKSYLWIVENISAKKRWKAINPDKIIDLEDVDDRFKGQKVESVCILAESDNSITLLLAADNDNGSSTLFRVIISKE
ncbi:MAG TPA: hypothetical protein PLO70_06440 [Chitinophagaceae bacterium]|nr:hypothetical protein [Chitinophagaceae bacterium]HQV85209.1 hypothetical protein [Chitinophagaceae bacterium]HQZ74134.1 hypothetical protein [Chitinophagaceae bacterium]